MPSSDANGPLLVLQLHVQQPVMPAACSLQPAACNLQPAAYSLQPAVCSLHAAACVLSAVGVKSFRRAHMLPVAVHAMEEERGEARGASVLPNVLGSYQNPLPPKQHLPSAAGLALAVTRWESVAELAASSSGWRRRKETVEKVGQQKDSFSFQIMSEVKLTCTVLPGSRSPPSSEVSKVTWDSSHRVPKALKSFKPVWINNSACFPSYLHGSPPTLVSAALQDACGSVGQLIS
ncbi:hypothetical protein CRENBAI_010675 [Crenichthys baileyi]|uniref:Uncharacterized protein n=1 Tax=Crenichthys baileyi TaxID=28760 RepID=A0AAV9S1E5_9TELE